MFSQEIMHIMSEADENDDGLLAYNEFLPVRRSCSRLAALVPARPCPPGCCGRLCCAPAASPGVLGVAKKRNWHMVRSSPDARRRLPCLPPQIMVQIVYALRAKAATQDQRAEEEERIHATVEDALLRGMPRENLEHLMRECVPGLRR